MQNPLRVAKLRMGVIVALLVAAAVLVVASTAGGSQRSGTITVPKVTVGFLNILGTAPAAQRLEAQFRRGAKILGWDVKVVDAQGDPAKMAAGIQSFVTQNVDAIVTIAVAPAAAQQALSAAKEKGIPTIMIASPNPDPQGLYDAQIAPNDYVLSSLVTQYMIDVLGGKGEIVAQVYPPIEALLRRETILRPMLSKTKIKIVATHVVDFANAVQDTVKSTLNMLKANPNASAVWAVHDFQYVPIVNAIKNAGLAKKVKVFGFYAGADALDALRKGGPAAAVADAPVQDSSWIALDQLLQFFAEKKPIDPLAQYDRSYPMTLITSKNVPKTGNVYPFPDAGKFFVAKWKAAGYAIK